MLKHGRPVRTTCVPAPADFHLLGIRYHPRRDAAVVANFATAETDPNIPTKAGPQRGYFRPVGTRRVASYDLCLTPRDGLHLLGTENHPQRDAVAVANSDRCEPVSRTGVGAAGLLSSCRYRRPGDLDLSIARYAF
jgi:hypothetical protein